MSTAKTLKEIADTGKFERLASDILRLNFPNLQNLIHCGINELGKPVKDKLDGIYQITKNHFAFIAITTNISDLATKWLNNKIGDLPKAIGECLNFRKELPNAKFEIFLVTNSRVSSTLVKKVYAAAPQDFIEITIVDQSLITSILDTNPEGQYLRKIYFEIETDRLSHSLLIDLIIQNIETYKTESSLNNVTIANIQERKDSLNQLLSQRHFLNFLVGESGSGKSTLLCQFMEECNKKGILTLRIYPEVVQISHSILEAFIQQLKRELPSLYLTEALLRKTITKEIILIVDDINKEENPFALLEKLKSWGQTNSFIPVKIVCPIWPKHFLNNSLDSRKSNPFNVTLLAPLTKLQAVAIIESKLEGTSLQLSYHQKQSMAKDSGNDPLLIALYLDNVLSTGKFSPDLGLSALSEYLEQRIDKISEENHTPSIKLFNCLSLLGREMLEKRNLEPSYNTVFDWFRNDTNTISCIDKISSEKYIFNFNRTGKIIFRHDKVRDFILIDSLLKILDDIEENLTTLSNPYYAELIGASISKHHISAEFINRLMAINPLAVICTLKFIQSESMESSFRIIVGEIQKWCLTIKDSKVPLSVIREIGLVLVQFDTREITSIAGNLPVTYEIALARFRSGDPIGAIYFFSFGDAVSPQTWNYWRDIVIDHVKFSYPKFFLPSIEKLFAGGFTDYARSPAYKLAGFLKFSQLIPHLQKIWSQNTKQDEYIDYLWAIVQCAGIEDEYILEDALLYWTTLAEKSEENPQYPGPKSVTLTEISRTIWTLSDDQVSMLIDVGKKNEELASVVSTIIKYIGTIDALSFTTNYIANQLRKAPKDSPVRLFIGLDRWDQSNKAIRLSKISLGFLQDLWNNPKNDWALREVAFSFWCGNEKAEKVIVECSSIQKSDQALFIKAIYQRMKLKDVSVTDEIIEHVSTTHHIVGLDSIWNDKLTDLIYHLLKDPKFSKSLWQIENLLNLMGRIPTPDAERILVDHWETLKKCPQYIGMGLYISTSATRQIAEDEINQLGFKNWDKFEENYNWNLRGTYISLEDEKLFTAEEKSNLSRMLAAFKHIDMIYGCAEKNREGRITEEKLNSLIPYLRLLGAWNIRNLTIACIQLGYVDWMKKNLYSHLQEYQKELLPTDEDIIAELEEMSLKKKESGIHHLIWDKNPRALDHPRLLNIIRKFAQQSNSFFSLKLVCALLEQIGSRKELDMIENYTVTDGTNSQVVDDVKSNTRYQIERKNLL